MTRLLRVIVAAGATLLAMAASAPAQMQGPLQGQYPNKPITLIVPFGPGSTTDTISRIIAQHLGQALNQSVVIGTSRERTAPLPPPMSPAPHPMATRC